MSKRFAPFTELRERFPFLRRDTVNGWASNCPPLGRAVATRRNPRHSARKLYSVPDVEKPARKMQARRGAMLRFTDGKGKWIAQDALYDDDARRKGEDDPAVAEFRRGLVVGFSTISKWVDEGKVKSRWEWNPEVSAWRKYLREEDLLAAAAGREPSSGSLWAEAGEYGFSHNALLPYCRRKVRGRTVGKIDPLLRRLIKSKLEPRFTRGRVRRLRPKRVWRRADLKEKRDLLNAREQAPPPGMMDAEDFASACGMSRPNVTRLVRLRKLRGVKKVRGGIEKWFIYEGELAKMKGIDRDLGSRSVPIGGEPYRPIRDAAVVAGVPWHHLRAWKNKPNPKWGGITVHAVRHPSRLFRSKHSEPWVCRDKDLIAVRRHLSGLPADVKSTEAPPANGNGHTPAAPLPPKAAAVEDLLKSLEPGRAMLGPAILEALACKGLNISESYFLGKIIPRLRPRGLRNERRVGYYYETAD